MKSCQECIDFIVDYLDGRMAEEEQRHFEDHLRRCPPCISYLDSYRETIRLAREAGRETPAPPQVPEALICAILATRKKLPPGEGGCCGKQ